MTTLNNLKAALDQLLNLSATKTLLQLNSNTGERAYEAYVFGLCIKAVRNCGGQAVLVGIQTGKDPNPVVLRGGPGSMASKAQNFCYAACTLRKRRFEIHLDIEYLGQSEATHEIDISVYDFEAADRARNTRRLPRTNKPLIMAFECKFYTTPPGVDLARGFVGLINDCAPNKLNGFISNKSNPNLERYLSRSNAPEPFIDLSPLNSDAEDRFVRYVEQVLRKWVAGK